MYDVFVSYARIDGTELARPAAAALEQRGRQVWIDVEDMLPGVEFTPEIRAAIDGSDAFVMVVSDRSMASTSVCRLELEHAIERGKRIIPIRRAPVGVVPLPTDTPHSIRRLDVISVGDADTFAAGIDRLIAALDLDLAWIRQHTRLLLRATEWIDHDDGESWLLRGGELDDAEQWLASPPPRHQLLPTISLGDGTTSASVESARDIELQRRLIDRSRQWADHVHDEEVAARMLVLARTAFARGPAARPLAARLAIESMTRDGTTSAYELLDECRAQLPVPSHRIVHDGVIGGVSIGAAGAAATFDDRGGVRLADASTGETRWTRALPGPVTEVAVAADGERMATGGDGGAIDVWDVHDGTRIAGFAHPEPLRSMEISADGSYVVTSSGIPGSVGPSTVRIFDVRRETVAEVEHDMLAGAHIHPRLVSAQGPAIATGCHDGAFRLLDVDGGVGASLQIGADGDHVAGVTVSPTSPWAALRTFSGVVRIVDLLTGGSVMQTELGGQGASSCAFGPDGSTFAAIAGDGTVIVWEVDGWTILARVPAPQAHTVRFGAHDNVLIVFDFAWAVRLWQIAPLREVMSLAQVHIGRFAVAPDTGTILMAHDDRRCAWVLEATATSAWQPHSTGSPTAIVHDRAHARTLLGGQRPDPENPWISPDHPRPGFAAACGEAFDHDVVVETPLLVRAISPSRDPDEALIVDQASLSRLSWETGASTPVHSPPRGVATAAFATDGHRAALIDGDGVLVELVDDPLSARSFDQPDPYTGIAMSPDGRTVVGRTASAVVVHDVDHPSRRRIIPVDDGDAWAGHGLALSADGMLVAVAVGTNVDVYDTSSGRLVSRATHQWSPYAIAFGGPGPGLLVSASASSIGGDGGFGDLRVWEASTGRHVLEAPLDGAARALGIAPDGTSAAVATDAGGISMFRLDDRADAVGRLRVGDGRGVVTGLAYSETGRWLFAISGNRLHRHLWRESDLIADTARRLTVEPAAELWQQATAGEPYRGPRSADDPPH